MLSLVACILVEIIAVVIKLVHIRLHYLEISPE